MMEKCTSKKSTHSCIFEAYTHSCNRKPLRIPEGLMARSTEKDITGFFEKAACGKAFSAFFINPYCLTCSGCDTFSFFVRTEKDIR